MEEVEKFLKEAKTYYLVTIEGAQPRVRPFGTAHIFEGKLYIQTDKKKDASDSGYGTELNIYDLQDYGFGKALH